MTDMVKLKKAIDDSGMTMTAIAKKGGIARETLYNRLNGIGEFTASEIVGLSYALKLTKRQRDEIFLTEKLNKMQLHRERRNKMNELQVFKNQEFGSVRTLTFNDEPWFVGKDVALVLKYSNPQKAIRDHVDEEDRTVNDSFTVHGTAITLINESGLYSLILSSKLPSAKKFKRWVTSEVLPALRKTGQYQVKDLSGSELMARALIEAQNVLAAKDKVIEEMKPKASYYDVILNCKGLLATSVIAKDYGWSAIRLNEYLHKKGIQFKQGKTWLLYQKYATEGYASTKTHEHLGNDGTNHANVHTYWTQKGRRFIYDLLKNDGIVPLIERDENG